MKLHLDYETFSELDLKQVGVFTYAEHPSTEIIVCCWAVGDGPVQGWTRGMPVEKLLPLLALVRQGATVGAHNAMFEYVIWNTVMRRQFKNVPPMRAEQLDCTAARSAMAGLPRALERAGAALGLTIQKDKEGGALIRVFCKPRKPSKSNPSTRVLPKDEPVKWRRFMMYCAQDVRSERALDKAIPALHAFDRVAYIHDLHINERGLPIDTAMVRKASEIVDELARRVKARATKLTRGIRPTQRDKLLNWIQAQGIELENLQADTLDKLLKNTKLSPEMRELIEARMEAAKASVKKLVSMARVAMRDGRARGTLLYYGAHTGRWSGKLIQPQNYIRGLLKLWEQTLVFRLLACADADLFEAMYDKPLYTIAQVMRGFIAAKPGKRLLIVDYSQIEARLLVWLAGEQRAIDDYRKGVDRYIIMAAFLWGINEDDVTDEQRRIAKNLVLGCGFGLGWRKFIEYCAKAGIVIDEELSQRAVKGFRELHPAVKRYWGDVERCAIAAVRHPGTVVTLRNVQFMMRGRWLCIKLPSGRCLYYPDPELRPTEKFGKPSTELTFMTEYFNRWVRSSTYGGRLVENIVQAIARDIMVVGIHHCEGNGYPCVGTVHDELISELAKGRGSVQAMAQLAVRMPKWAAGCPVDAKGFEAQRYRKD